MVSETSPRYRPDILERAKKALIDDDMTYEDYDECISLLIAEVERLRFNLEAAEAVAYEERNDLFARVERLRSENKIISDRAAHHEKQDAAEIELLAARIKELEALNELNHKNMRSWLDTTTDKEFLDKLSSEIGFKDAYIKRLEAEFLEATKEIVYAIHEGRDAPEGEDVYAEKVAREALERIKAGGKDEA